MEEKTQEVAFPTARTRRRIFQDRPMFFFSCSLCTVWRGRHVVGLPSAPVPAVTAPPSVCSPVAPLFLSRKRRPPHGTFLQRGRRGRRFSRSASFSPARETYACVSVRERGVCMETEGSPRVPRSVEARGLGKESLGSGRPPQDRQSEVEGPTRNQKNVLKMRRFSRRVGRKTVFCLPFSSVFRMIAAPRSL